MVTPRKDHKDNKESSRAKLVGVGMALSLHLLLGFTLVINGFKVTYPPPPEMGIEIEIELEPPQPVQVRAGSQPRTETPTSDDIRLVQRSESTIVGSGANRGAAATMGETGDVELFEPPRDSINRRALFPSAANADSTAAQVARQSSNELRAGHAEGNTRTGSTEGEPQAKLEGRSIMGSLPIPEYTVNMSGTVVVRILVNQHGAVTSATPGATGTTVQDRTLWEASKNAALKAQFNLNATAPAVQEGTITYIFKLR